MSKPILHLMRGPSGAGKSTLVHKLRLKEQRNRNVHSFVYSTDDGHRMVDGVYKFDPYMLPELHAKCLTSTIIAMSITPDRPDVYVDNTFIAFWELQPYLAAASLAGYDVEIHELRPTTVAEINLCASRGKAPATTVYRQACGMETFMSVEPRVTVRKHTILPLTGG